MPYFVVTWTETMGMYAHTEKVFVADESLQAVQDKFMKALTAELDRIVAANRDHFYDFQFAGTSIDTDALFKDRALAERLPFMKEERDRLTINDLEVRFFSAEEWLSKVSISL